jgi:coenzyme Q-binding protein COQ10
MSHLSLTGHYDAPIEHVFELATDFDRYLEWNVTYTAIKAIEGPPDKVGTKVHSEMRFLGRTMEGWGEIVEFERPRLFKTSGESTQGGKLTQELRLTPAGTGTDYVLETDYELPAGFIGKVASKLFVEKAVERDLKHSIENFKAMVETKEPVLV